MATKASKRLTSITAAFSAPAVINRLPKMQKIILILCATILLLGCKCASRGVARESDTLPPQALAVAYEKLIEALPSGLFSNVPVYLDEAEPDKERELQQLVHLPEGLQFLSSDQWSERTKKGDQILLLSLNEIDHGGRFRYVIGRWSLSRRQIGWSILMCLARNDASQWKVVQSATVPSQI